MASRPIMIEQIRGMLNSRSKRTPERPQILFNMDSIEGKALPREGYTLLSAISNCSSVYFVDGVLLCSGDGSGQSNSLYRISPSGGKEELFQNVGHSPLFYLTLPGYVYISSRDWSGKYNRATGGVENWGVDPPTEGPQVTSLGYGSLPSGIYTLCFTKRGNSEISGSSPLAIKQLHSQGGFLLENYSTLYDVWITEANGTILYFADSKKEILHPPGVTPLPSEGAQPPKGLSHLEFHGGRVWGVKGGDTLQYSHPTSLGWFYSFNSFSFGEEIRGVASDDEGLFVFTERRTFYLRGRLPEELILSYAGDGLIEGCLIKHPVRGSGKPLPIWMSSSGIYLGSQGQVQKLSEPGYIPSVQGSGAGYAREDEKGIRVGFTAPLKPSLETSDSVSVEVLKGGRLANNTFDVFLSEHLNTPDVTGNLYSEMVSESISTSEILQEN